VKPYAEWTDAKRLSQNMSTLRHFKSTLSLKPRAAATKNKTRMAEKAFMILNADKNHPLGGSI